MEKAKKAEYSKQLLEESGPGHGRLRLGLATNVIKRYRLCVYLQD